MNELLRTDEFGLGFVGYTREQGEAMLCGSARPEQSRADWPCIHRKELLEIGACDLCGSRGQPFEILRCSIYGRCSIGRRHSQVKSCAACEMRMPNGDGEATKFPTDQGGS